MKLKDFIKRLQDLNQPEMDIVDIYWCGEDVEAAAADRLEPVTLTQEQIESIVDALAQNHDACNGINWDTIGYQIDYEVENNE